MCGITGGFWRDGRRPDPEIVAQMNRRLTHRGPDDQGQLASGPVILAMRRLSIIDLAHGQQPMSDPSGRHTLVYNGEIYNTADLRAQLSAEGVAFRTHCDTEVLLHGLIRWGPEGLSRFNGMFALALWDAETSQLLLARDRMGQKPLYYDLSPGLLLFGSELSALRAHPQVSSEVCPAALSRYLTLEYVPTPRAILKGVQKLPPGSWLRVDRQGEQMGRFWDLPFDPPPDSLEGDRGLLELLEDSVRRRLVADVPVGVFLSGGIDSSAVAAMALREGNPVRTFSIAFEDSSFDESHHARSVARHLGTEHLEQRFDPAEALALVHQLHQLSDEPLGDASLLPTTLLCRFAREHVTVALSGEGSDELFGGYPTYLAHRWASCYRGLGPIGPCIVAPMVRALPASLRYFSLDFKLKRFVRGAHRTNPERHVLWMGSFAPSELGALLTPEYLHEIGDPLEEVRDCWRLAGTGPDWQLSRRLDIQTYLQDNLLAKADRASMSQSLELRTPFLDHRLVTWAERQPPPGRGSWGGGKQVLRKALAGVLPAEILQRAKHGFPFPVAAWLRCPLRPLIEQLLGPDTLRREGIFAPETVAKLVAAHLSGKRDERKKLWTLLAFRLWHQGSGNLG